MQDSSPPIVRKKTQLIKAAVLAKQTVVRDFESEPSLRSTYTIPEFLEVLCRVVEITSENTKIEDLFLLEKLTAILNQLLNIS